MWVPCLQKQWSNVARALWGNWTITWGVRKVPSNHANRKKTLQQVVYIVNGLEEPLPGRKASNQLELIQVLCLNSTLTCFGMEGKWQEYTKSNFPKMQCQFLFMQHAWPNFFGADEKSTSGRAYTIVFCDGSGAQANWRNTNLCWPYTILNETIEHEKLVLPSVEETLIRPSCMSPYSKPDAKSGF